jgi:hypothetical protein
VEASVQEQDATLEIGSPEAPTVDTPDEQLPADDELEHDDDDESPPEPEPEPEPEGLSPEQLQKLDNALTRKVANYRRGVEEFIEAAGQPLIQCGVCFDHTPGYLFHPGIREPDEEQQAFARVVLGEVAEPQWKQDPKAAVCPSCDGWGRVRTGSKVEGKGLATCSECKGRGAVGERFNLLPDEVAKLAPVPDFVDGVAAEPPPDEDSWGTPRNHPDFGKLPQYRDVGWQDALTAWKQGQPAPLV